MKNKRILVGFTEYQMENLQNVSKVTGIPIAVIIRQAVEMWIYSNAQELMDTVTEKFKPKKQ